MASTFGETDWAGFYSLSSCTVIIISNFYPFTLIFIFLLGHCLKATKETLMAKYTLIG